MRYAGIYKTMNPDRTQDFIYQSPSHHCLFGHNPNLAHDCAPKVNTKKRVIAGIIREGLPKEQADKGMANYVIVLGKDQCGCCGKQPKGSVHQDATNKSPPTLIEVLGPGKDKEDLKETAKKLKLLRSRKADFIVFKVGGPRGFKVSFGFNNVSDTVLNKDSESKAKL